MKNVCNNTVRKNRVSIVSMAEILMSACVVMAFFLLPWFVGCTKLGNSTAGATDSTRTFGELVENSKDSSQLNREERAGKMIYARYCQVCHGAEGDGRGFNAFNLQNSFGVQPEDFTDSTHAANRTSERAILVISKGGVAIGKSQYMPPWERTLSAEEIENITAYINVLSKVKKRKE